MPNKKPPAPPSRPPRPTAPRPARPAARPPARPARSPAPTPQAAVECEAEVILGLENAAQAELEARLGGRLTILPARRADTIRFRYRGDLRALNALRAVVAVYRSQHFPVPRPKALLGVQHFTALVGQIETVRALYPPGTFQTLRISAAGEESTVLHRLRTELAAHLHLTPTLEEADLLVRLRRAPGPDPAWEALVRLSPRPLTARAWRVCNWPGALNAVVAHAMMVGSHPRADDRVVNLVAGSGTLLIERLALAPARWAVGADKDQAALACAHANIQAAGLGGRVRLVQTDVGRMPLPDGVVDLLTADLPFGQLVGSHAENLRLYPAVLAEASRVAAPGARLVLVTHEVRLLERLLAEEAHRRTWATEAIIRVTLPFGSGGLTPRIYTLRRLPGEG